MFVLSVCRVSRSNSKYERFAMYYLYIRIVNDNWDEVIQIDQLLMLKSKLNLTVKLYFLKFK